MGEPDVCTSLHEARHHRRGRLDGGARDRCHRRTCRRGLVREAGLPGQGRYNDGEDRFCARADEVDINDRAIIEVKLIPYDASRGPTISFADIDTAGATCRSLATAYEDTYYKAVIKSLTHFDRGGDSSYQRTVVNFYS